MKKIFIFLLIFSSINANIAIDEAWNRVQYIDEGIKASTANLDRSYELKDSTLYLYAPEINIDGTYARLEKNLSLDTTIPPITIPGLGTLPAKNLHSELQDRDVFIANLSILWPLYTGGKIDGAREIYSSKIVEAKAKHKMKKDEKFLRLVKIYYGVVMSKELLKTRLEVQNALLHHYENAKKLKDAGQIPKIEVLNAVVKLDSAKIETTKAKHKYEITKLALNKMLDKDEVLTSNLFINLHVDNEEIYKRSMMENYAGLDVIKSKQSQINSLIKIEQSDYMPTIFAFGNYLLYKDHSPLMDMTPRWNAGVGIKLNILSRKGVKHKIAAATILRNSLTHTLNQAKKDLSLLVEKTYKEMLQYKKEYEDLSSSLKLAKENIKLRELAFKEGLATSVEVVDAQMFLAGAKTKRLNAIYNYVKKISQLSVLSGDSSIFFKLEKTSLEIK